ncbi:MAG: ABC transporter ATP-binding protein [Thermoplasmata archaeon]
MLDIEDLQVRYENRSKPAVDRLTLHIDPGEFVLLMGGSASGKSTAMQAVCGFIPEIIQAEKSGTVKIDGKIFEDATSASNVACMVQQDPETQFCMEVVEDEVAFGPENFNRPRGEIRAAVDEALAGVSASHLAERRLSTLSGGEKQKVAIASMLAMRPKLLILDEPTSNLDPRAVREVVSVVDSIRRDRRMTIIVVEHRPGQFIDLASRVIIMNKGRLELDQKRPPEGFGGLLPDTTPSCAGPTASTDGPGVVSVRGLTFDIAGVRILDDLNLDVRKGSVVALMGENGAGKTTLLKHLTGLLQPGSGGIQVLKHEFGAKKGAEPWTVGKDVGFVFQNPNHQIFERTVEREILFATENYRVNREDAVDAVAEFEASEEVRGFVHPHCLSFGQKRRVNIRSASSHGPALILMDEPFAGQDAVNAARIRDMISRLRDAGKTIIIVTHDIAFAREACTDVVFMRKGKIVRSGPISDLSRRDWLDLFPGADP